MEPPSARHTFEATTVVASMSLRDLRRNVGAWRLPAVSAALFALLFLGGAAVTAAFQARAADLRYLAALDGDLDGARVSAARLAGSERLSLVILPDAVDSVSRSETATGLHLPQDLDRALVDGTSATLVVFQRPEGDATRSARAWLEVAIHELVAGPGALHVVALDVADDAGANRARFAGTLAGFTAFLVLGVVTSVASVLAGTRERRGAEALLVLPVSRVAIAAGAALGALPMGLVYVGTGLVLLLGSAAAPLPTLALPAGVILGAVPGVVLGAALLVALGVGLGAVSGALGGGSADAMSVGDLLAMPVAAVGVTLVVVPDLASSALSALLPGVGAALVVRDAVGGALDPTLVAITVLAGTGWVTLAIHGAGRLLERETNVRRN